MSLNSSLLLSAPALPSLGEGVTQANQFVSLAATEMNTAPNFRGTTEPDTVEPLSDIDKFLAAFGTADSEPPHDDEQDQDEDHALPETGALLVPGPAGPGTGTGPAPEPVPVLPAPPPLPGPQPLPAAPQQPPVPLEPVAPQPVLPGTQPAPVLPDPLAPSTSPVIPQPTASVPGQLPGSTVDGSGQGSSSTTGLSPGPTDVIKQGGDTHGAAHNGGGSGSSSSSSSFSSFFGGGGGKGGPGLVPSTGGINLNAGTFIGALGSGSLVVHSLFDHDGDAEMSFGDGGHQDHTSPPPHDYPVAPPILPPIGPDPYAQYWAAYIAYNQAAAEMNHAQSEQVRVNIQERITITKIDRADKEINITEAVVKGSEANLAAKTETINANNTMIARHEETIEELREARKLARTQHDDAERRSDEARTAISHALDTIDKTLDQAIKEEQAGIIIEQGTIMYHHDDIAITQRQRMDNLDERVALMENLVGKLQSDNAALRQMTRTIHNELIQVRPYLDELQRYVASHKNLQTALNNQYEHFGDLTSAARERLEQADELMHELRAFKDGVFEIKLTPIDDEPDWDEILAPIADAVPADPALPPRPPVMRAWLPWIENYIHGFTFWNTSAVPGATHTTTSAVTIVPDEEQTDSHPAAGPVSFNVATDPTPGHDLVLQGDHGLNVQIDMAHPALHSGSSTEVLHFAAVVNKLPVIGEIVQAWMRTLPASSGIAYAAVDVLDPHDGGPVSLAIRFASRSDHAAGANGELPAEAVATLKSAIQGAAAVWEHEQEGARLHTSVEAPPTAATSPGDVVPTDSFSVPTPLPGSAAEHANPDANDVPPADNPLTPARAPLHHGFDGLRLDTSVLYAVEFAAQSGNGDNAVMAARSGDWQAIGAMLAHWMERVDPGFAASIVAFEVEDWGSAYGGVRLELLLNEMLRPPSEETGIALQQEVQAYLTAPASHADGVHLIGVGAAASVA